MVSAKRVTGRVGRKNYVCTWNAVGSQRSPDTWEITVKVYYDNGSSPELIDDCKVLAYRIPNWKSRIGLVGVSLDEFPGLRRIRDVANWIGARTAERCMD